MQTIKGKAKIDSKTKNLVKRINPGDIAVINHKELDEVCANALVDAKVKAVINANCSLSNDYPNVGPLTLVNAGIYIIDNVGEEIMEKVCDNDLVEISGECVNVINKWSGKGEVLTNEKITKKMLAAQENIGMVMEKFVQNTIEYASYEQNMLLGDLSVPETKISFENRQTLIVVRGQGYKEDLSAIMSYIEDVKPVLVGVDGGADALIEFGYKPDIIIGDMDSITDRALKSGAEIIVHAYQDGRAPGLDRVNKLGLSAAVFPSPGTSEDIAMLLAYHKQTELIVAVGTHSNLIDFLEKGRKGMSSTFLVRLKVGSKLVDAKGVSKLYKRKIKISHLAEILAAGIITFLIVSYCFPISRQLIKVILLKIKVAVGI